MAVPGFQVEYRWCLNGLAIPVEIKDMFIVDPLNLADTYSLKLPDYTEVNLVSFKATGDMNWLCKSLQLPGDDIDKKHPPCRWWSHNSNRVPLLMEIKEAIKNLKLEKEKRSFNDVHSLILLEIRGQLLYVRNNSVAVTLGLAKEPGSLPFCSKDIGEPSTPRENKDIDEPSSPRKNKDIDEFQPLVWFLSQLQKDIDESLQDMPEQKAASVASEHEEQVQEVMEKLKAHPQCHLVHFLLSRMLFRIRKKNLQGPASAGKIAEFKVLGLNKWRKTEGASGGSQDPFQKCLYMGLNLLDEPEGELFLHFAPPAPASQQ